MKNLLKKFIVSILEAEASLVLKKYKPKIIGVTGNIGKTSTKEAIHAVLSKQYSVRKSQKSYNSELGVPLTVLGLDTAWSSPLGWIKNIFEGLFLILFPHDYPQWLVLEIGADRPGDIAHTLSWVPLDIGVVTYIGEMPVHIEFFPSQKSLIKEKAHVADAPKPPAGLTILNHDNEPVFNMRTKAKAPVLTFGFTESATVCASNERIMYVDGKPEGISFKIDYQGKSVPVRIHGVLGTQVVYTVLPAILIGAAKGMNLVEIIDALQSYAPPPGRVRIVEGIKETTIIDDTYNSSPHALEAALVTLKRIETTGKKIAVLGDMMELGKITMDAHTKAGEWSAGVADLLYVVGQRARFIAEGAEKAGLSKDKIFIFEDAQSAGADLQNKLHKGDVVLVKGSQYVRMEKAVEEIMAHPEHKETLLVRQDTEWQNR